jgi:hypothetical protein
MAHLTVPADAAQRNYTAAAAQTVFAIPFPFFATADIKVYVAGVLQSTGYTITGTAADGGFQSGTCTFAVAPGTGVKVALVRSTPIQRVTDFPYPSTTLDIRSLNTEFDRITGQLQEGQTDVSRLIRVGAAESGINELPAAAARAGLVLAFDANGQPVASVPDTGGVTITTWAATLLDDADAATARGTLGLSARWWQDGTSAAPVVGFASTNTGLYRHTASVDPATGSTHTLGVSVNGVGRYRFFESVLSCFLPAGDNFGISDGVRVFHIGNDGSGYYITTSTNHYLTLSTFNGTGPGINIGDPSGGGNPYTGRISTNATWPFCFGTNDTTGASNGVVIDAPGDANTIIRSTSGAGSRSHVGFYKAGGTLVGSITTTDSATAFNTTSDERLKVSAGAIPSGTILDALEPFMHTWVNHPTAPAVPGMSAQAVYEVAPYCVRPGAEDLTAPMAEPWSADWSKLIPVLVAEIKDLRARVAALE